MPLNLAGGVLGGAVLCVTVFLLATVGAEDPYRFFNWNVTYGDIYPLGVRQQGILINGQFPGPDIHSVTNDNLIINVFNSLNEPFLLSWFTELCEGTDRCASVFSYCCAVGLGEGKWK
ncbi:l-ascorbate oxidase like protein [Quercus suber]|uniref:L-ascorbate oxidase like protein n=1 Tax=Quercus suber TaxID=58331 RepID=A0AAW0JNN2_QUESU